MAQTTRESVFSASHNVFVPSLDQLSLSSKYTKSTFALYTTQIFPLPII
jgi:hypothetical protein